MDHEWPLVTTDGPRVTTDGPPWTTSDHEWPRATKTGFRLSERKNGCWIVYYRFLIEYIPLCLPFCWTDKISINKKSIWIFPEVYCSNQLLLHDCNKRIANLLKTPWLSTNRNTKWSYITIQNSAQCNITLGWQVVKFHIF